MSRPGRRRSILGEPGTPMSPLPTPVADTPRSAPVLLLLLMAIYLIAGLAHASLVPMGQTGYQNAPDEQAHVNYVRILASGRLPTRSDELHGRWPTYEWHQPPLYYAVELVALPFGVHALRLVSILIGLGCIWVIYRIALLVFPEDHWVALTAAGIAALTPGHMAITSVVNNDGLLELCFSAVLLTLIAALRNGFTRWRAGWLGIALGAALLTKVSALLLLPVIAFCLILTWRDGEKPGRLVQGAVWTLMTALVLCGWWYGRNMLLYHEWLPLRAFAQSFQGTAQARDVVSGRIPIRLPAEGWTGYWLLVSRMSFDSFWAVYGTPRSATYGVPVFLPDQIYLILALVSVSVIIGLLLLHLRRKSVFTQTQMRSVWLLFSISGICLLAFVGFLSHYFQTQGRYLYPAMSGICILIALGWRALFVERYRQAASVGLVSLLGVISLVFFVAVQAAAH